jgi:hypothetical protein
MKNRTIQEHMKFFDATDVGDPALSEHGIRDFQSNNDTPAAPLCPAGQRGRHGKTVNTSDTDSSGDVSPFPEKNTLSIPTA